MSEGMYVLLQYSSYMYSGYHLLTLYRFLLTKSCRRRVVLDYFGEDVDKDTNCVTMAVAPCDNCSADSSLEQANKTAHFKVIADAISDVPNHGIKKVILL